MAYKRQDRVADLIKEEIATMLMHGEIKDPRIGFVTITHVKLTEDLKEARVFFSHFGTAEEREKSRLGLQSAGSYIRRNLAKRLKLRRIPAVEFLFDDSIEYSERIERLIRDIKGNP
ncbi:MAG: 30S ribosome-binding factor RbfA [Deltaproteobacteria bacterium]